MSVVKMIFLNLLESVHLNLSIIIAKLIFAVHKKKYFFKNYFCSKLLVYTLV